MTHQDLCGQTPSAGGRSWLKAPEQTLNIPRDEIRVLFMFCCFCVSSVNGGVF